jgi:hypothetical protein
MTPGERLRETPPRIWIPAAMALLVAFLLRDFLFGGAVFYKRDVHLVWHPQVEAFVRAVAAGSWPVWDPSPGFGQPLLADPSAQILYPFTWLNLVMLPWTYYTVFVAVHAWFSACGMAALARAQGLSPLAAFGAGALWLTSGPFISLFDLWHHFAGACWMPWVVLAAHHTFEGPSLRNMVRLGLAAGMLLLAGSADVAAMTAVAAAGLLVGVHLSWRAAARRDDVRRAASAAGAAAIAMGLSCALWLVAVTEAASGGQRWNVSEATRTYWSVHPLGLLETLSPWLFTALSLSAEWRAAMTESREPFLVSLYLGIGTWTLAAVALRRDRRVVVLAVLAVAALAFALGRHSPFHSIAITALPPLRVFRYPVKAMILAAFTVSLLAGHGLERWRRDRSLDQSPPPWRLLAWLPVVLAAIGVAAAATRFATAEVAGAFLEPSVADPARQLSRAAGRLAVTGAVGLGMLVLFLVRRRDSATAAVAAALAVADLAGRHRHPNPLAPADLYRHRPEVVDIIRRTPQARVFVYDYTTTFARQTAGEAGTVAPSRRPKPAIPELAQVPVDWTSGAAGALSQQMALVPASAGRWDVEVGWSVDYRLLYPRPLAGLGWRAQELEGEGLHRLLRTGGITHAIAFHEQGFEKLKLAARVPGLWERPLLVYEVPDTLPRTYATARTLTAAGGEPNADLAAMWRVLDADFEPTRELVLEVPPAVPPRDSVGTSRILARRADAVRIEARMSAPGYVVLLDAFSPGWRATVNGRPAAIVRANGAFRAVVVPEGTHTIEMIYRPPVLLAGLALSALTASAGGGYLMALALRNRAVLPS